MKRLGQTLLAYLLLLLSMFALCAQAFGLKASILTFGIVHLASFGLIMTWWWLEQIQLSRTEAEPAIILSPSLPRKSSIT